MRIAYICADPGVPVFGCKGCSIHVQEIIRSLIKLGAEVDLFAMRVGGASPPDLTTVCINELLPLPKSDTAVREKQAFLANSYLHSKLRCGHPYDLVYERYSLWSFAGMQFASAHGIPSVLEVNAPLIEEQELYRELINRKVARGVAKRVFGLASVLIAVSKPIATYLKRYPNTRDRVHVIPNGVNPDRFSANTAPSLPASLGTFTVGFVGSLKPWHGLSVLIQAFSIIYKENPNTRLLIVGDGTERESLEADLTSKRLNEAVILTGMVAPSAVPSLLASMDVAVAPYATGSRFYFSPLKVYEYMAAGLPVVASRVGQLRELITDKANGFLCPPGDPEALAKVINLLRQSPELRATAGKAARETVLENYTWDSVARRVLHLADIKHAPQITHAEAAI